MDFTDAGSDTCTANTLYTVGQSCTVNVAFTPEFSGNRYGAVVLYDNVGNVIENLYLQGTGVGPQVNFLPGTQSTLGSGFNLPMSIVSDGSGNVFVGGEDFSSVYEIAAVNGNIPASPTINLLGGSFQSAWGLALDGSGNLFVADFGKNAIYEMLKSGGYTTVNSLGGGFFNPWGVAVDGAGNTFVADYGNNAVKEIPPGCASSACVNTLAGGFNGPSGVAVDGSGNVFVADLNNHALKEILAASGYTTVNTLASGLSFSGNLTLDGNGNAYLVGAQNTGVLEVLAAGGYTTVQTLPSNFNHPQGVGVDGAGNVLVADNGNNRVVKLDYADAPSLSFAITAVGSTSSDSPQTVTVENVGNAALDFPIPSSGNNPSIGMNFTLNSGVSSACPLVSAGSSTAGTLVAGASCELPISFTPTPTGALTGALLLADNNLNAGLPVFATQSILLSGTTTQVTPAINWATPAPIIYGTPLSGLQLNATSTVAGTLTYTPAAGTILTTGTQTLTVTFTPTDSTDYRSATTTVILTVNQSTPTIYWSAPAPITYGTALSGTQLNAVSVVAGTFAYSPAAGTVLTAGTQTLTVTFTPTDTVDYTTATATVSLSVNQAIPIIAWPVPAAITYGTALSASQLNASSTVAGTFTYSPSAGTELTAGLETLTAIFTPTDTIDYPTATATVTLTVNKAIPAITWTTPSPITYGTALSAAQLNATSTVAGTFTYSPSAGAMLTAGTQTLTVTFTPTDTVDYTAGTATTTLLVNQAAPALSWASPTIPYGTALSASMLNASSTVPGSFAYSPAIGTVLTAGTHAVTLTFTPTDTLDYTTATASATVTVNRVAPAITWPTPAAITYGTALSGAQLNATSTIAGTFTYSPAAGTVLAPGLQTLTATFTPTDATDYTTATATVTLTVNKATPVITWATPAAINYGTALSATQLNATSSVAGTFTYSPAAGTVLAAGAQTLSATLIPTNVTDYTIATATVTLTVNPAPSFTLSPSLASLTLSQGTSGKSTLAVVKLNGFSGSVTLAASGLPSGVTASFATNPTTGSTVLTLAASSTATTGTATVTVKGTSGSLIASTTISLTVNCTPTTITPYISINGGSTWTEESGATVNSTSVAVDLGPQPASGGSWSWTGPNKYTSTSRQLNNIPLTVGTDSYVATYTNPGGCKSTETFTITVK
jgi:hypothetical protein